MNRLLRLEEITQIIGVSRSTIYSWMRAGKFPRSVKIGPRSVRWNESDVADWLREHQPSESDSKSGPTGGDGGAVPCAQCGAPPHGSVRHRSRNPGPKLGAIDLSGTLYALKGAVIHATGLYERHGLWRQHREMKEVEHVIGVTDYDRGLYLHETVLFNGGDPDDDLDLPT